jgi:hypothetical protein
LATYLLDVVLIRLHQNNTMSNTAKILSDIELALLGLSLYSEHLISYRICTYVDVFNSIRLLLKFSELDKSSLPDAVGFQEGIPQVNSLELIDRFSDLKMLLLKHNFIAFEMSGCQ